MAERARVQAQWLLLGVLGFMAVVSLWTPLAFERIASAGSRRRTSIYLWPVPLVTALTALMLWRWLMTGREILPFLAAIVLFLLGYLGLVISSYPYSCRRRSRSGRPRRRRRARSSCWSARVVLLPVMLGYVVFVYWLFRGKVREGEGYH